MKCKGRPATRVQEHQTVEALKAHYKQSRCAVEQRRTQAIWLLLEGRAPKDVQQLTQYSDESLRLLVKRYNEYGLLALKDKRHANPGPPPLLTDAELLLLAQAIRDDYARGELWNGERVVRWVKQALDKEIYPQRAYELLSAVAFSQQVPRPSHALADPAKQEEFKKTRLTTLYKRLSALLARSNSGLSTNIVLG